MGVVAAWFEAPHPPASLLTEDRPRGVITSLDPGIEGGIDEEVEGADASFCFDGGRRESGGR